MAKVRVVMHSAGSLEVLTSTGVRDFLHRRAEAVAARARSTAPVEAGEYRSSIGVRDDTTDRAVALVVATAPHSRIIESRTGNLVRALGSEGG